MTAFPSYAFGTVSVDAGSTTVTGTDTLWSGVNVRAGDDITIAGHTVIIVDVTDETHLVIDEWPYDAVTAGTYKITQRSPLRFVGAEARADVTRLLSTLEAKGLVWTLDAAYASPNDLKPIPTANEGQLFYQSSTGKFWAMTSGAWTSIASPYGLQAADIGSTIQAYDADLASIAGLSPADNDFLQRKSGAWVNRTPAQAKADLSTARVTPEEFNAPPYPAPSADAISSMIATGQSVDLFPRVYNTQALDTVDVSNFGEPSTSASFQSVMAGDSLIRGRDNRAIGYAMNHREELMYSGAYPRSVAGAAIATGNMVAPPISSSSPVGPVDIIAHWYGVWGIDWTRLATGVADDSFDGWYDWHWNWTTSPDYDSSRHPIFGWYRQQDPKILDWQCYWLREAGVKAICPVAFDLDITTWTSDGDMNNWIYQLFYNTPNFRQLSYIPWVKSSAYGGAPSSPTSSDIVTQWDNIIFGLHDAFPNNYVVHHKGRRWMALYLWDSEFLRTNVFDTGGGSTNFAAFLAARGLNATYRGYDGIALMCHNSTSDADMSRDSLLDNNVLYLDAPYGGAPWSPGASDYSEVVSNFAPPSSGTVLNVSTSLLSKAPISEFSLPGSTPALFRNLLGSALTKIINSPDLPKCLSVYNVSEWAEGGPGLTPNRDSGFGYLDAIREASAAVSATPLQRRDNYVTLTLQNSWVNFGAAQEPARVRIGADGIVHVTGLLKNGTSTQTTVITTLPVGYRPKYVQARAVATAGGTTSVLVNTDGTITLNAAASSTLLDISLSFMAAV